MTNSSENIRLWFTGVCRIILILVLSLSLTACSEGEEVDTEALVDTTRVVTNPEVEIISNNAGVDLLQSESQFSTLVAALDSAGLIQTLRETGPYTVFAPTNEAFNQIGGLESLMRDNNLDSLRAFLLYHVVPEDVTKQGAQADSTLTTLQGEDLFVRIQNDSMIVNDAHVVESSIQASNGHVYVIDSVLRP